VERDRGLAELGLPRSELKPVKDLKVFRGNMGRLVLLEMIRDRLALRRACGVGAQQAHQL
jgi:hypothetical protein